MFEPRALDQPACCINQAMRLVSGPQDNVDSACLSCTAAAAVVFVLMVAGVGALLYNRRRRQQRRKYGSPKQQLALPDVETGSCVTPAQSCDVMSLRDRCGTAGCVATLRVPWANICLSGCLVPGR